LPDQWELYNLDLDPIEVDNRFNDPSAAAVFAASVQRLADERDRSIPVRNTPWPYVEMHVREAPKAKTPPPPVRGLRKLLGKAGFHPEDPNAADIDVTGKRALVIATNHGVLDVGKPTGVFASEMTVPYYAFLDAGMGVDIASPNGGVIPVDPQSLKPVVRTPADDRFLADDRFREQVTNSLAIAETKMRDHDLVFLAGGWGAAFDFATSNALAGAITEANGLGKVIGGVCHGPLGLVNAVDADGEPLVKGRNVSAVTDKQVRQLGIESTPFHPETELRRKGAAFQSKTARREVLANHWVVDGNLVTGQNQNAGPMVARGMMQLLDQEAVSG